MADTVDSIVLVDQPGRYVVRLLNVSDNTGESGVAKVDISGLKASDGTVPVAVDVLKIQYAIEGFRSVKLDWDHTTNDEIITLTGTGEFDFTSFGGLKDPRSAGGTGDILLTTTAIAAPVVGDTYSILLSLKLRSAE